MLLLARRDSKQFKFQELEDKYDTYPPQIAHKMPTFVLT